MRKLRPSLTYADDLHAAHLSINPQASADALTVDAETVGVWAEYGASEYQPQSTSDTFHVC